MPGRRGEGAVTHGLSGGTSREDAAGPPLPPLKDGHCSSSPPRPQIKELLVDLALLSLIGDLARV